MHRRRLSNSSKLIAIEPVSSFEKTLIFRNIRKQTDESRTQDGFPDSTLPLGAVARLSARKHVPFAIDHRAQCFQILVVDVNGMRRLTIGSKSASQLFLQSLTLLTDLLNFGLVVTCHLFQSPRLETSRLFEKRKPVSLRNVEEHRNCQHSASNSQGGQIPPIIRVGSIEISRGKCKAGEKTSEFFLKSIGKGETGVVVRVCPEMLVSRPNVVVIAHSQYQIVGCLQLSG